MNKTWTSIAAIVGLMAVAVSVTGSDGIIPIVVHATNNVNVVSTNGFPVSGTLERVFIDISAAGSTGNVEIATSEATPIILLSLADVIADGHYYPAHKTHSNTNGAENADYEPFWLYDQQITLTVTNTSSTTNTVKVYLYIK